MIPKKTNPVASSSFVGPFDGLDVSNLVAAYCPGHRLFSATNPNTVRVRRTSDLTESDFTATSGELDEAAVSAFVGASDGLAINIYDQIGSATLNLLTNAPRLFNGGALGVLGSGFAPEYGHSGTATFLFSTLSAALAHPFTVVSVILPFSISSGRGYFARGVTPNFFGGFNGSNFVMNAGSSVVGQSAVINTKYIVSNRFDAADSSIRVNGVNGAAVNPGTNGTTGAFRVGVGLPGFMQGMIGLTLIFNNKTSDSVIASYEAAIANIFGSFP